MSLNPVIGLHLYPLFNKCFCDSEKWGPQLRSGCLHYRTQKYGAVRQWSNWLIETISRGQRLQSCFESCSYGKKRERERETPECLLRGNVVAIQTFLLMCMLQLSAAGDWTLCFMSKYTPHRRKTLTTFVPLNFRIQLYSRLMTLRSTDLSPQYSPCFAATVQLGLPFFTRVLSAIFLPTYKFTVI
jgi:hypothetical protein